VPNSIETPSSKYGDLIAAGSVYQINQTTRLQGAVNDAFQLFAEVAAGAPHAALIEGDTHTIVSASPECFFALDGEQIYSQPMKGTAARGSNPRRGSSSARLARRIDQESGGEPDDHRHGERTILGVSQSLALCMYRICLQWSSTLPFGK